MAKWLEKRLAVNGLLKLFLSFLRTSQETIVEANSSARAQSALTNLSFVKDETILNGFLLLVIGAFVDIITCPGLRARVNATT